MKKTAVLFWNMIFLTATMLFMRTVGILFSAYLSKQIGSSGIGGYQLILSVYSLAMTLAISGIKFTATRLISEEVGKRSFAGVKKAVRCCLGYALSFGSMAGILLFVGAPLIGQNWIQDNASIPALKALAVSLPFLAVSAVIAGYLTAVRNPKKGAVIQISDQFVMMVVTILCLKVFFPSERKFAFLSLALGTLASELITCILLFISYQIHQKKEACTSQTSPKMVKRMLSISLPIAFSAYARSGLSTIQNLLIPRGLQKSGLSHQSALSAYGTVHGMALPVLLYPAALLSVLAELMIPELTECQVQHQNGEIDYMVNRVLKLSLLFALNVMAILFCLSGPLGLSIYQNSDVSFYIKILAPLVIVMYMDTIVDGMLKGLGEQLNSMKYNIIDSFTSVLMVWFLLPIFGIKGYLITVMVSEVLNFSLSLGRLIKITHLRCNVLHDLLKPFACTVASITVISLLSTPNTFFTAYVTCHPILLGFLLVGMNLLLFYLTSCLKKEEFIWIFHTIWPKKKAK
jgi:O-antigen/teichoic acid export membrane protein